MPTQKADKMKSTKCHTLLIYICWYENENLSAHSLLLNSHSHPSNSWTQLFSLLSPTSSPSLFPGMSVQVLYILKLISEFSLCIYSLSKICFPLSEYTISCSPFNWKLFFFHHAIYLNFESSIVILLTLHCCFQIIISSLSLEFSTFSYIPTLYFPLVILNDSVRHYFLRYRPYQPAHST